MSLHTTQSKNPTDQAFDFDQNRYDRPTLGRLQWALNDAWRFLRLKHHPAASRETEIASRAHLAQTIDTLASRGERDTRRIVKGAVQKFVSDFGGLETPASAAPPPEMDIKRAIAAVRNCGGRVADDERA
jgi:hypothetical protein